MSQSGGQAGVDVTANTTADGLVAHPGSDGAGVEVTGAVRVTVSPPEGTDFRTNSTELTVTDDRDVTVEL